MSNSRPFSYNEFNPNEHVASDNPFYPAPAAAAAGHAWSAFPQPPSWPPFPGPYPAFDRSRPPPGPFEPPPHAWSFPPHQSNPPAQFYPPSTQHFCSSEGHGESQHRPSDEQWLQAFLRERSLAPNQPRKPKASVCEFKETLYSTLSMVSELHRVCKLLRDNLESEELWTEARELKSRVQEGFITLTDPRRVDGVKRKLQLVGKRRARMRRRKAQRREEEDEEEARRLEREAAVEKWQMKRLQQVEEKKREKELKQAADAVLSEVRKKQSDTKRMLDILKSLEKLRVLRREAAARRGMFPEKESGERFEGHLRRLRALISKRTGVYAAEEKALRVMLEGEQEEERQRERENRLKKEREKLLQKKREVDAMLFGAEFPPGHPLGAFQDYYTQAEQSLPALLQIRREWDQFLLPPDHPDGTPLPHGWVLPDQPADHIWATALDK